MQGAEAGLRDLVSGTDLEATLQPLERATMLPPAAFLERGVLDWELENVFMGGWICVGHVSAVAEPGAYISPAPTAASTRPRARAAPARGRRRRARSAAASSARTTPGPTTLPATSAPLLI